MKIAIPKEKVDGENRVAASPEVAGKLVDLVSTLSLRRELGSILLSPTTHIRMLA